jgi:hypothetical protein
MELIFEISRNILGKCKNKLHLLVRDNSSEIHFYQFLQGGVVILK